MCYWRDECNGRCGTWDKHSSYNNSTMHMCKYKFRWQTYAFFFYTLWHILLHISCSWLKALYHYEKTWHASIFFHQCCNHYGWDPLFSTSTTWSTSFPGEPSGFLNMCNYIIDYDEYFGLIATQLGPLHYMSYTVWPTIDSMH